MQLDTRVMRAEFAGQKIKTVSCRRVRKNSRELRETSELGIFSLWVHHSGKTISDYYGKSIVNLKDY